LTKATYDAIGAHFRKLWGQEAGWAHSVLFTADLRSFSDRLATKVEVKVKQEDDVQVKTTITSTVAVKRPLDEEDTKPVKKEELVVQAAETVVNRRRSKRQRR
jgi:N-glycosylase/DNA lyase